MSRSSLSVAPQVLAEDGKPVIVLKKRKFMGRTVLVLWCRVCRTDRDCEHMQKKKEWGVAIDEVEAKHTHNKNRVDRIHPSRNTTAHHVRTNCNLPRKDQRDCCYYNNASDYFFIHFCFLPR